MKIDYSQADQEIQSRHFLIREEPLLANFSRFFSGDPRFPFSIAYPQQLEPFYDDTEYLHILSATFGKGTFGVIRSDITRSMPSEDQCQFASEIPLSASPQIDSRVEIVKNWVAIGKPGETTRQWQAEKVAIVGEPGFNASRMLWMADDGRSGEWIIFQFRLNLWTIFKNSVVPFSSDDFITSLRSFRFLDEAFFHALGVRWSL